MRGIIAVLTLGLVAHAAAGQDLRVVRSIGTVDGPSEYTFHRVTGIAVGSDGRIYVLDSGDQTIRVYSVDGRFLRRFGRSGAGPGEFQFPTRITVSGDTVIVADARLNRQSRFTLNGMHLSTDPMPSPGGLPLGDLKLLRHGMRLGQTIFRASLGGPGHDPFVRVLLLRPATSAIDTLATYQGEPAIWSNADRPGSWGLIPTHLGEGGAVAVAGDSLLALADGNTGIVRWLAVQPDGLRTVATHDLQIRGRPSSENDARLAESEFRSQRPDLPPRIQLHMPPIFSALTGRAFFDDRQRLWLELNRSPRSEHEWLSLTQAGEQARIRLPLQFTLRAVSGRLLYGVWSDDLDVQTIRVYEVGGDAEEASRPWQRNGT